MKYRELMESCDRILESPEIKMFDQYMLVNDFKNFYLESHNFIKDNIMSLPYEFSKDIYSEYFIEEEEVGAAKANGDGNKKSNSSDGGWTKDSKGQYEYKEGDHFINALKAIANFFIRIWEVMKGAWNTIFKTGNEYDWVSGARKTIASSADSPGAPAAAMAHSARAMANINGTLETIDHNPFLKGEFGEYSKHFSTIMNALSADKREAYEENESSWINVDNGTNLTFGHLLKPNTLIPNNLSLIEIKYEYTGAKIRIKKIELDEKKKNIYDSGGSKENEQNYDIEDLTESLLIDLANKYANDKIENDTTLKNKPSEEKEKAKPKKIEEFFNQTLSSLSYKIRPDYSIVNKNGQEIVDIFNNIRSVMKDSVMTPEEKAVHQAISTIQINCIQLVVGVMDSAVYTLEKMWDDAKSINNITDPEKNDAYKTKIETLNKQKKEEIVTNINKAKDKLFSNDKGYATLLNKIASMINITKADLKDDTTLSTAIRDNGSNPIIKGTEKHIDTNNFKFNSIGKQIFTSIFLLMLNDYTNIITVSPNIDQEQAAAGINQIANLLGIGGVGS